MLSASATPSHTTRPLGADDAERVIAIDRALSGHSRRRFFEKRFAAAEAHPDDFIHVGVMQNGGLCGFAIARVLRGEFGHEHTVAVLDAIGVEIESRERGVGKLLMHELVEIMTSRGVRAMQSQSEWTNQELLRFFAAAGFKLAPRLALQRSVTAPLDEPGEEV